MEILDYLPFKKEWYIDLLEETEEVRTKALYAILDYAFRGIEFTIDKGTCAVEDRLVRMKFAQVKNVIDTIGHKIETGKQKMANKGSKGNPDQSEKKGKKADEKTPVPACARLTQHYVGINTKAEAKAEAEAETEAKSTNKITLPSIEGECCAHTLASGEVFDSLEFFRFYNTQMKSVGLPIIRKLNKQRLDVLLERANEFGKDALREVVEAAVKSDYIIEKHYTFPKIMEYDVFLAILEGGFANKRDLDAERKQATQLAEKKQAEKEAEEKAAAEKEEEPLQTAYREIRDSQPWKKELTEWNVTVAIDRDIGRIIFPNEFAARMFCDRYGYGLQNKLHERMPDTEFQYCWKKH